VLFSVFSIDKFIVTIVNDKNDAKGLREEEKRREHWVRIK
jgi:hypothetical protein